MYNQELFLSYLKDEHSSAVNLQEELDKGYIVLVDMAAESITGSSTDLRVRQALKLANEAAVNKHEQEFFVTMLAKIIKHEDPLYKAVSVVTIYMRSEDGYKRELAQDVMDNLKIAFGG